MLTYERACQSVCPGDNGKTLEKNLVVVQSRPIQKGVQDKKKKRMLLTPSEGQGLSPDPHVEI